MRHLGSLIAGIVAVPLGWLLLAFGQAGSAKAFANVTSTGTYHTHDFIRPLIFLAVAGIVIGLIATLRISPVGPLVAGVVYAGSYVALLIAPRRVFDALSYNVKIAHQTADLTLPLTTGASLAVGAALLVAVVSADRWRRWPRTGADAVPAEAEATESTLTDDTLAGGVPWEAFRGTGATTTAGDTSTTSDLPTRTPTAWPARTGPDETTEPVPAKGLSPWDTPLRGTSANQ
ncbi:MAG: hypothetical protein V7603_4847 [Micromonosporaceae bacterium]